jgi:3D (Asp-Asp-Asp) domain-containing protein
MDRMRMCLNRTVGIACLFALLQIGIAQSKVDAQYVMKDQQVDSFSPSTSTFMSPDLAPASDFSDKTKSEVKPEPPSEALVLPAKIGIKNPLLNFKITLRESKMEARGFEAPASLDNPLNFRATAYALKGRTRSGAFVRRGVIAADPRVLPLGSVVQVHAGNWSGVYTVHDTGGKIKGNIIDVWVPTYKEARTFGRRPVKINVLRYGPKRKFVK